MQLEITFMEKVMGIMEKFVTKNISRSTISYKGSKKFSDVVEYVRAKKFGTDITASVIRDTDNGMMFVYELDFGRGNGRYTITIHHRGETITDMTYFRECRGAVLTIKSDLNKMDKELPDYEPKAEEEVVVVEVPTVDYSKKDLKKLVDIFDEKLQELESAPSSATLQEIVNIKKAISDKINKKPVAERAPYKKPLADMGMYIDALNMQFSAGSTQFVGTYVPQIATALAELAEAVNANN
ncbi:MAG: hypothetical protein IKL82_05215 [Clostridia bacterium]|nr:hypothetical protein [Clostridia bacterium]